MRPVALLALAAALALPVTVSAQDAPVPENRTITTVDQDFYGGDLGDGTLTDTTFSACRTACLARSDCTALTFNSRNKVCFLKSGVERVETFEGAISARIVATDDAARQLAAERVADLAFIPGQLIESARQMAMDLGARYAANGAEIGDIRKAALDAEAAEDLALAIQNHAAAATLSDAGADWRDLARVLALHRGENATESKQLRHDALLAAINAYLRAEDPAGRATTLNLLADRLEQQKRSRDMIPALELSLALDDRRETREKLAYARSRYGFRVIGHTVDSDAVTARICVTFSDPLAERGVDYAPYLHVPARDRLPVEVEGKQLCIDGLPHGQRVDLTVRPGLVSATGEATVSVARIEAYIRDRAPSVRFAGRAHVLPKTARASIPLVTVNMTEVDLAIHRIGPRNLLPAIQNELFDKALTAFREDRLAGTTGEAIWSGTVTVENRVNVDVTTAVPVGEAIDRFEPGVYAMSARIPGAEDRWDRVATQWFIVTDLGVASMSGADGLHGFVRTLSGADPVADSEVTLLARNNDILGTGRTDAQGYVRFDPGLVRGLGGAAPALLTVEHSNDFAFLDLDRPGFDLSDRGVEGRPAPGPVDVFATTERGVYRPGEVVHLTALARDGAARAIDDLPLTLVVLRPDGVEYQRAVLRDEGAGGRTHGIRLGHGVPRGPWKARIYSDPGAAPVAERAFLVEDFVPERLDFDLTAAEGLVRRDEPFRIALAARYLYGAPGAGLTVGGTVSVSTTDTLPAYPGYRFGLAGEDPASATETITPVTTDATGAGSLALPLPAVDDVTRPLSLTATVEMTENSGRPVERTLTRPLASTGVLLGIKPGFDGAAEEGGTASFDVIAVGPDGARTALDRVGWTLSRLHKDWQWYQLDGRWRWEATTRRERVASGTLALSADERATIDAGVAWGAYELMLTGLDDAGAAASHMFQAGWYTGGAASDTPDLLQVGLDKPAYKVGDTAKLRLTPRHAGKVLIAVVDNRLIDMQAVDVEAGETTVDLSVTEDWGPGAYVTATLIRPLDTTAKRNPSRAMGLAWATVDPGPRKLDVTVTTPDRVAPRGPFNAAIRIDGLAEGAEAYVTLAAVDAGILNLTSFASPDPAVHYFGQRALGVDLRDVYGKLIDGMQGAPGRLRSGGDAATRRQTAAPPTEELVAYFSGVVTVGPEGTASARFQVPDFNGTVRVMAVAWTADAVGHAEKDVLVRDPIVVSAAMPRFLAPQDESRLLLDVAHAEGATGVVEVTVTGDGSLSVGTDPQSVAVAEGGIGQITLPVAAREIGDASLTIATRTPDGKQLTKTLTLPVRRNDAEIGRQSRIPLPPGGRLVIDRNTFAGLESGTAHATLGIGPMAEFDAPGLLQALDRYPYGCTEQITSRALPLLYLDELATALGMDRRRAVAERIDDAIARVLENQSSTGSFGLWRPGQGDLWLDAYVTDFLSRARAKGHEIPAKAFDAAIDNLRTQLSYATDFKNGGEDIAYALMVLAREGAASIGDLRYYADAKADDLATPMAHAQLGAALAMYGETSRSDRMFDLATNAVLTAGPDPQGWRVDYGSGLRDGAAVLALAAEVRSEAVDTAAMVAAMVAEERRHTSTQEKVWMLLATTALIDQQVEGLTVNGIPATGGLIRAVDAATLAGGQIVIENTAATPTQAMLTTFGVPVVPEPTGGTGYRIERAYFSMDGQPVSAEQVIQNDRLAVVLTVHADQPRRARLMVDDPLPAGFEIDNPNLLRAGATGALDWLKTLEQVENVQFLTERFLAAVDHDGKDSFRLAYIVRAVSPGRFHHPAAVVEDMYRPDFRAWTDTGTVTVVAGTP